MGWLVVASGKLSPLLTRLQSLTQPRNLKDFYIADFTSSQFNFTMRQMRPPTISQWLWSPARTYLGATSLSVAQSRHHSGDSDPAKRTGQRQQDRTQCLLSRHEARGKEKKVPPAEFMKNPRRGPLELHEAGKKRDQLHDQPSRDSELREGVTRDFRKTKDDGKISGEEVLLYKTKLESGSIKGVSRLNRYHRTGGPSDKKVNDSFLAFRGNRLASDVFASSAFLEKVDDDYKLPDREEVPNPIKILEEKFKDYQREERHREDLLLSDEAKPPRIGEGTPNTTQDQTALPDIFGQSPFAKHQEELAQRGIDGSDVFISLVKKREQEFELQRRNRFQKCMQMFRTSPSSCEGDTLASWFALGEILAEKIEKEFLEKIRQEISEKLDLGKLQETSQGTSRFCPEPEPEPTEPTIPLSCLTDHLNLSPALSFIQLMRDLMPGTENADLQPWDPWSAAACRLPYGAHLVYFPLPTSASRLAADGADQDHVPPGFVLSPDGVKEGGRRLWAGGSLEFSHEWIEALRLKGPQSKSRVWECTEEIAKHEEKGSNGTIMVDLLRYYGRKDVGSHYRGKPWQIRELRQLAFVKGDGSKPGAEKRIIKCGSSPDEGKKKANSISPWHSNSIIPHNCDANTPFSILSHDLERPLHPPSRPKECSRSRTPVVISHATCP